MSSYLLRSSALIAFFLIIMSCGPQKKDGIHPDRRAVSVYCVEDYEISNLRKRLLGSSASIRKGLSLEINDLTDAKMEEFSSITNKKYESKNRIFITLKSKQSIELVITNFNDETEKLIVYGDGRYLSKVEELIDKGLVYYSAKFPPKMPIPLSYCKRHRE